MHTRIVMDRNAKIGSVATALRRVAPSAEPAPFSEVSAADASASDAASVASDRKLRVGVLVDLEYAPSAGGHVKCWQRLAEAAVDFPEALDLTVHFHGPEKRELPLSPSVRLALLPPVFSTERLLSHRHFPDHTDIAPWHAQLAQALLRYDVIHTTDAFFCYSRTAMRFARRHRIPLVSSIHTNTPEYARITVDKLLRRRLGTGLAYRAVSNYLGMPNWIGWFLERRLQKHLAFATAVVGSFVGEAGVGKSGVGKSGVGKSGLGNAPRPHEHGHHRIVIRRGLDRSLFSPAQRGRAWFERRFGLRPGDLIAVYAGKLNAGKNVPLLAPIIQRAQASGVAIHLFCAGEGEEQAPLQAALGPACTFAGLLSQHELARAYASADLFLFPSEIDEFGSAAQEALACGLPVLAARGSGFASSMADCLAVRILPGDDPEPWAAAIAELAANPHRRGVMRRAARLHVERHVPSWGEVLEQDLLPVWRTAAQARKPARP
jgi:glycosyltransferase involved in cell wall biosynthesis